ncbi:MAG: hybrid sensor histidine kinase/response regulator, partial [Sphingopyxis sp.]|nr:hybrid sensor histidine kinase/response regulator [Sphingopyxis sp.]
GEGTSVAMLLPVARPQHADAPDDEADDMATIPPVPADRLNILVVEDDRRVLAATVDAVSELGHKAVACASPLDAERLVEGHGGFDLILSDVLMPELTGPEMVAKLKQRWPDLAVLFVTGYAGDASEVESFGDHDVLRKPFTLAALDQAIQRRGYRPEGQRLAS